MNTQSTRVFSNIVLIGFMGVGKSSCGRLLAQELGFQFLDTDQRIRNSMNSTIPEIFAKYGEATFRAQERELVLQTIPTLTNTVISTGGGMGATAEYLDIMRQNSLLVHLCLPPKDIYERIKKNKNRPLLQTPDPLESICELLKKRLPIYHTADVEITTLNRSIPQIVFQIILQFQRYKPLTSANDSTSYPESH